MECSVFSSEKIPAEQRAHTHQSEEQRVAGFLENLHRLLDEHSIGSSGQRIVSWNADGLSFQIHDAQKFERLLIPLYFGNDRAAPDFHHARASSATQTMSMSTPMSSGIESFLNRVRDCGFHRIETNNIYRNTFSHPLFVRGKKNLIVRMGNIGNQEQQALTERRHSWPMPALGTLELLRNLEELDEKTTTATNTATTATTTTTTTTTAAAAVMVSYDGSCSSRTSLPSTPNPKQKSRGNTYTSGKFEVPIRSSAAQSLDKPFLFRQALQRHKRLGCIGHKSSARNNNGWNASQRQAAGDPDLLIDLTTDENDNGNENQNDDIATTKSIVLDFDDWVGFDSLHHHQQQHQNHQQPTTTTSNVEPLDLLLRDEDSLLGDDISEPFRDDFAETLSDLKMYLLRDSQQDKEYAYQI